MYDKTAAILIVQGLNNKKQLFRVSRVRMNIQRTRKHGASDKFYICISAIQ